jgi:DNA-binding GntR family transcriptional regulator
MRPITRPPSLVDTVAAQLRELIVSGELPLGKMLSERNLAEAFGVSKTPVREALAQLKNEGLVRVAAQRGATVFSLSGQEVVDICEWRQTLEAAALRMAFERDRDGLVTGLAAVVERMRQSREAGDVKAYLAADTAYHRVFFRCCRNHLFMETYELMETKIAALRTHLSSRPSHTDKSFAEHIEMLDHLRQGDLATALACLTVHIDRTRMTYSLTTPDITSEQE